MYMSYVSNVWIYVCIPVGLVISLSTDSHSFISRWLLALITINPSPLPERRDNNNGTSSLPYIHTYSTFIYISMH